MPRIDPGTFAVFNWAWIGLAVVVFVSLFFVTAPYGRHLRAGWLGESQHKGRRPQQGRDHRIKPQWKCSQRKAFGGGTK